MNIDGVNNGIVLDHIKAGKSMLIYKYLGLGNIDQCVALIQNCSSSKMGKKDIIKIDQEMDLDMDVLGFIDPNITVNYVKDGHLERKAKLVLPEKLTNVLKCKNPRCICSIEQELPQVFHLVDKNKRQYRCIYCDTVATNVEE